MGNCFFKARLGEVEEMIKVVTSNGGIMELYAPITAECITNEFPGHAIFQTSRRDDHNNLVSQPLLHNQELLVGQLYYLLPLNNTNNLSTSSSFSSSNSSSSLAAVPYRMSFDNQRLQKRTSDHEVFPRYNSRGVWKVKLVISPEQLSEILSQENRTEALIESVRTVAKCGNGFSSLANSDQWSLSSSHKAFSDNK